MARQIFWRENRDHRVDGANWRAITLFLAGRIMVDDVEVEVATWRKVSELDSTLDTDFDGVQGSGANLCQQSHEHGMTMRTGR